MPVFFGEDPSDGRKLESIHRSPQIGASGKGLSIGLINNMADKALKATERQYISLLNAASGGIPVSLSFYTLPGIPRSPSTTRHITSHYANEDDLFGGRLDGLIVTGREPLAASLRDEAYWPSFAKMVEWAQENTYSTIWSCLAAHAAVLQLDSIDRVRRTDKLFGVFDCERIADHALLAGAPSRLKLPHSRWSGLPEQALADRGYSVLTRTADGEVDTFVKQQDALFLFFQGHPEYEADTLLREYRRDILRYGKGELCKYPLMPQAYFDRSTVEELTALQWKATSSPGQQLLPGIRAALSNANIENTWQSSAIGTYANWLGYINAQKEAAAPCRGLRVRASTPQVRWAPMASTRA